MNSPLVLIDPMGFDTSSAHLQAWTPSDWSQTNFTGFNANSMFQDQFGRYAEYWTAGWGASLALAGGGYLYLLANETIAGKFFWEVVKMTGRAILADPADIANDKPGMPFREPTRIEEPYNPDQANQVGARQQAPDRSGLGHSSYYWAGMQSGGQWGGWTGSLQLGSSDALSGSGGPSRWQYSYYDGEGLTTRIVNDGPGSGHCRDCHSSHSTEAMLEQSFPASESLIKLLLSSKGLEARENDRP